MQALLDHFQAQLNAITALRAVETDEGQVSKKIDLTLPAAYYDITNMDPTQAGENISIHDTQVKLKLVFEKTDGNRFAIIGQVKMALVGTGTNMFSPIILGAMKKTDFDDCFVYELMFYTAFYDFDAQVQYITVPKPPPGFFLTVRNTPGGGIEYMAVEETFLVS
ncbi:MAG: hypothetical protein HC896_00350 [Bacteroidales bacterium]|nr:hypothetical protein [Bacteroidales bacterium]